MNIIQSLINRIEEYRATNKNPCKNYASQASAEKAAEKYSKLIADYYSGKEEDRPNYLVFFNPAWGRWCVAFDIKPQIQKYGGYMGIASHYGFFSY